MMAFLPVLIVAAVVTQSPSDGISGTWMGTQRMVPGDPCSCISAANIDVDGGILLLHTACNSTPCNEDTHKLPGMIEFSIFGPIPASNLSGYQELQLVTRVSSCSGVQAPMTGLATFPNDVSDNLSLTLSVFGFNSPIQVVYDYSRIDINISGQYSGALDYPATNNGVPVSARIAGGIFESVAGGPDDTQSLTTGIIQFLPEGKNINTFTASNSSIPVGTVQFGLYSFVNNTFTCATSYPGVPSYPPSIQNPGDKATRVRMTKVH